MSGRPQDAAHGVRVFISYAHADDALRASLRDHLDPLERDGLVHAWDDREIQPGAAWADEIDERLDQADVILLLVTAAFMRSDYCRGKELARALERNADPGDRAIVIPVILRRCDWETSRFAHLQALPPGTPPRPISEWKAEEDYYTAVAKGLRERIGRMVDPDTRWTGRIGRRLRDPRWWQKPRVWAGALAGLALVAAGGNWWRQAAARADNDVADAVQAMRTGRYLKAVQRIEPACRRWVSRDACFTLEKARLGTQLERPDKLQPEAFAAQLDTLKREAPNDPDLVLFAAELALHENRPGRQARALEEIGRAIELAGGNFPEAYFYLADLELRAGRYAQALPLLDKALDPEKNKAAPDHYLNARAYARARTGDIDGALQDYEQSARGSILSRIEMAELLWRRSEFDRASNQLRTATLELGTGDAPLARRNVLPWSLELTQGKTVVLRQVDEKRCHARWMLRAGLALAGRPPPDAAPTWDDCGPDATKIASAVAASLMRAVDGGMNATGRQRVHEFATRHKLSAPDGGGG